MKKQKARSPELELGLECKAREGQALSAPRGWRQRPGRLGPHPVDALMLSLSCLPVSLQQRQGLPAQQTPRQPHSMPRKRLWQNTLLTLTKQLWANGGAFEIKK